MARHAWKALMTVGLLSTAGWVVGCDERQQAQLREDARDVGRETSEAVEDVKDATRNATEGFREGYGGSGQEPDGDADIGRKEGVINDGEGPFEQQRRPGEEPSILDDGKGPLEDGPNR
ncbi:hypothetical protein [Hyalangium rubrum]|uniref:Latency associated antigen n=1 Tax=Hyalangium rubrum TaxID=3103134 RepID=A0ABU5H3G9_9BACT|nr:hypothetical protein [Hyalangium sp. s54d21]MDY7227989.1 hypothetical protein [Hyalangium sp. s54d21]